MTEWSTAEVWLEKIKSQHRSSPEGYAWHQFWQWLSEAARSGTAKPPMPFILVASGESAASKFGRLREQLRWAHNHGILADALRWLDARPMEEWNTYPPDRWEQSFYL